VPGRLGGRRTSGGRACGRGKQSGGGPVGQPPPPIPAGAGSRAYSDRNPSFPRTTGNDASADLDHGAEAVSPTRKVT
jgi:hypothetical protein